MKEGWITIMGNKVRYLHSDTAGQPLIMLHGLGGYADKWVPTATILSRQYRTIIPDITGYGKSDKPMIDYTPEFFVSFLEKFIEALNLEIPVVVGASMGGQIAAQYASAHKGVQRLILISPAGMMRHSTPALDAYIMAALYPREGSAAHAFRLMDGTGKDANPKVVSTFLANMNRSNAKMAFMSSLLCFKNSKDITPALKKITIPTLLVWGHLDTLIPISYAHKFAAAIPNCQFEGMEGCGHTPYVQHPEQFAGIVNNFLANH